MALTRRLLPVALAALVGAMLLAPAADATVTATFGKRLLVASGGGGADRIVVRCDADGFVQVNGRNPKGGRVACAKVVEVDVDAGGGADVIDLSGVDTRFGETRFPGFGTATGTGVNGGSGNDRYFGSPIAFNVFFGEGGNDRARGGRIRDLLVGGAGDDDLRGFGGRDSLIGNKGADRLFGGTGADVLSGNAGNDRLFGGAGADIIGGGPGADRLRGGPGRDRLISGAGRDDLRGGPGRDVERDPDKKK